MKTKSLYANKIYNIPELEKAFEYKVLLHTTEKTFRRLERQMMGVYWGPNSSN